MTMDLLLGQHTDYPQTYSPEVLCPIPRQQGREAVGIAAGELPFQGGDIWNAYELSWLNERGKPLVATAEFYFPADSGAIIESKSFKLYLNSFNQSQFASAEAVRETLQKDLSSASDGEVVVLLRHLEDDQFHFESDKRAQCLDELDVAIDVYQTAPELLVSNDSGIEVAEVLSSHLLRSLCPVTGQPDWGSVFIEYRGKPICHESLLKYIVSYRQHQEFHEQCVERIFVDIMARCQPRELTVYARYVRRGGLDINPYRSTEQLELRNFRLVRQ